MDLHEIFREGWQWASEQMITFWWWWVWIQELFSGFVIIWRYRKWLMHINQFARYHDTGQMCLGGGMQCPNAFS